MGHSFSKLSSSSSSSAFCELIGVCMGRDRKAAREKEVEREHDVAKERLRQVLAENEAPSDTEEEPWRRPLYASRYTAKYSCDAPTPQGDQVANAAE